MTPPPSERARTAGRLAALGLAARTAWRAIRNRPGARELPPPAPESDIDPSERKVPSNRRAETVVAVLLLLAGVCGFGFTAIYAAADANTQLLGLTLGGALALLAAACIVAGKLVVPQETSVEERDTLLKEDEAEEIAD